MSVKQFINKIEKLIQSSFILDPINLEEYKKQAEAMGFDDVMFVVGDDHKEQFMCFIKKV